MLTPQIGIVFHTPCTWNYCPSHLSTRRDNLRLSCLLAQALMPLESIADLSDAIHVVIRLGLHYIRALRRISLFSLSLFGPSDAVARVSRSSMVALHTLLSGVICVAFSISNAHAQPGHFYFRVIGHRS